MRAVFERADTVVCDDRVVEISRNGAGMCFRINKDVLRPGEALRLLAKEYPLMDVSVQETPVEEIVKKIYRS